MTSKQRVLSFYPKAELVKFKNNLYVIGDREDVRLISNVAETSKKAWEAADKEIDQIMLKKLEQ